MDTFFSISMPQFKSRYQSFNLELVLLIKMKKNRLLWIGNYKERFTE